MTQNHINPPMAVPKNLCVPAMPDEWLTLRASRLLPSAAREIVAFERTRARDVEKEEDDDVSTNNLCDDDDDDDDDDQRKKQREVERHRERSICTYLHASLLRRCPRSWSSAAAVRQRPPRTSARVVSTFSRGVVLF